MDNCIEVTTSRSSEGYGRSSITVAKRHLLQMYAHRVAWEQTWGLTIPKGMLIRHVCDNPPCVNPLHLQLGTKQDNSLDSSRQGRHWKQVRYGTAEKKFHALSSLRREESYA